MPMAASCSNKTVLAARRRRELKSVMLSRIAFTISLLLAAHFCLGGEPLPGTQPLTPEGDLSAQMVEGIDRWLMRETEQVSKARHLDVGTPQALASARALLR